MLKQAGSANADPACGKLIESKKRCDCIVFFGGQSQTALALNHQKPVKIVKRDNIVIYQHALSEAIHQARQHYFRSALPLMHPERVCLALPPHTVAPTQLMAFPSVAICPYCGKCSFFICACA